MGTECKFNTYVIHLIKNHVIYLSQSADLGCFFGVETS